MVLEALGAAVSGAVAMGAGNWDMWGMTAGLATSGRGAQVDQAFQRKHDRIDYKVQRQSLHRDDISDLIQLTTGRMDMYNLVGALLLTFALQWITSSDLVVSQDVDKWPTWYSTVFVTACFSAVGYLLFSLWFAMHCSITAQALGTRMRLNFTRLSLPDNKAISKLKVPFYVPGGALEKVQKHFFEGNDIGPELRQELADDMVRAHDAHDDLDDSVSVQHHSLPEYVPNADWRDDPKKDDHDTDFEKHLRRWICMRGHWLSYDAYSRACMVVGVNQMLQALAYHVVAVCWKVSVITAISCLLLAKLLAMCVLRIDVDFSKPYTSLGFAVLLVLEVAPPLYSTALLIIYMPGVDWEDWLEGVLALPVFLMHSLWTLYLASQLAPADTPVKAPMAKEDTFETDSDGSSSISFSEELSRHAHMIENGSFGMGQLPRRFQGARWLDIIRLEQPVPPEEVEEEWAGVDPLPGRITMRFTLVLSLIWLCAGIAHCTGAATGWDVAVLVNCAGNNCTGPYNRPVVWPHARPRPHRVRPRRLRQSRPYTKHLRRTLSSNWPEPASFFQVESLYCGSPGNDFQLFLHNGFDMFGAKRAFDGLVELSRLGIPNGRSAVFCGADCFALIASGENTLWSLRPLNGAESARNAGPVEVHLPTNWRRISATWQMLDLMLAGWDGSGIVVARLHQDKLSGAWHLEQRFKVQPGAGLCVASGQTCQGHAAETYADVQAVQIALEGKALVVLHSGSRLDFWDLEKGALVEELDLGAMYRSMCQSEVEVFLARQSPEGPIVEYLSLASLGFKQERSRGNTTLEKLEN